VFSARLITDYYVFNLYLSGIYSIFYILYSIFSIDTNRSIMARLINGINGPFIGKAGSVIGYTVNGVGYISRAFIKKEPKSQRKVRSLTAKNLRLRKPGFNRLLISSELDLKAIMNDFRVL